MDYLYIANWSLGADLSIIAAHRHAHGGAKRPLTLARCQARQGGAATYAFHTLDAGCSAPPIKRLLVLLAAAAIMFGTLASTASALKLVAIPGPSGAVPFKSPGGYGPTFVASPPGDTHRVFVGTKDGYVYVIVDGMLQPAPFLDLHTAVDTYNEDGLFSIAFDPAYASNRRFYVDYSDRAGGIGSNLDDYHLDGQQIPTMFPGAVA